MACGEKEGEEGEDSQAGIRCFPQEGSKQPVQCHTWVKR